MTPGAAVVSVVRLDKGSFAGARLPRYEALRGEKPPDLETTVILPESVFRPPEGRRESWAVLGMRGVAQVGGDTPQPWGGQGHGGPLHICGDGRVGNPGVARGLAGLGVPDMGLAGLGTPLWPRDWQG